jgi:fatty-acyl-CoA synthase
MSAATQYFDPGEVMRWESMALPYLFERPTLDLDRIALVFEGKTRTYGQLRDNARRVANALAAEGIQALDRVALLASNMLEFIEIEVGIAMARGIMVPLNWRLRKSELVTLLCRTEARVLLVEDRFQHTVRQIIDEGAVPSLQRVVVIGRPDGSSSHTYAPVGYAAWLAVSSEERLDRGCVLSDPHEIIFTSGTTGRPKGAIWTNGTVMFNALQQVLDFGLTKDHSCYVQIDLYYIGGRHDFTWALLYQGGTVHIKRSSGFDAESVVKYVVAEGITHVLWVPTMLYDIVRLSDLATWDTARLRMIMCGGAPVPRWTIEQAQDLMPETLFVQVYGLTEGGGTVAFLPPRHALDKLGSAGVASMHNRIRVIDGDGVDCPPNQLGEILVSGPSVTAGYWGEPELTAQVVMDGWLHTGDQGYLDDDGFLFIAGRSKDMIISGGMNIFPAEIEDVLSQHPAVAAVAVVGEADERWGETVCAAVQLVGGAACTDQELVEYCKDRLAAYKKPRRIVFVDSLPRTASGKIQKFVLRSELAADGVA